MRNKTPTDRFPITDLSLYFDTVAKDRLDSGGAASRNAELLGLRDLMLRLADQEFGVLMRSFRASTRDVIESREADANNNGSMPAEQAAALYGDVRGSSTGSAAKVDSVA